MWQEFEQLSQRLRIPDLWQQVAVEHLRRRRDVVIDAPTGAGKTYVFEMLVEGGKLGGQAVYTVPTRALANDKLLEWRRRGWHVGIATGDLTDELDAPVLVATLETQLERILRRDPPRVLVVDEYQMIRHRARGSHYELTIALAPRETQLLLLSGSTSNAGDVVEWLKRLGRDAVLVETSERPVPLDEMALEAFGGRAPRGLTGYWPRVVAGAMRADLAPLLIFAPRRREAEKIARQVGSALSAVVPLALTREQNALAGRELARLLQQRVAWHHSGLSYRLRAGVIEPLAKAGHLAVIVATTGLAAGINFSVRSVLVASSTYPDGPYQRQLEADDLLQMFGRAGRRGLDHTGYVLVTDRSPRLSDGDKRPVKRPAEVGWPVLLRLMHEAAVRGERPLPAAQVLTERLFSNEPPTLGLEEGAPRERAAASDPDALAILSAGPSQVEMMNSEERWEPLPERERTMVGEAWVWRSGRWRPALADPDYPAEFEPMGRTWLMTTGRRDQRRYGREIVAAMKREGGIVPTRPFARLLGISRQACRDEPGLVESWLHRLDLVPAGRENRWELEWQGEQLMLRCDVSRRMVDVVRDQSGKLLIDPPLRTRAVESQTSLRLGEGLLEPVPDSPLHAWRRLGLIDEEAVPTRRGWVFSLFQHGEGLAIAAALEERDYPVEALVHHIANLRGPRLGVEPEGGDSERLAAACHRAYGTRTYSGYLLHGLPENYSEGLAEILMDHLDGRRPGSRSRDEAPAAGDLDRARVEWLSLLRRIDSVTGAGWERWTEFQEAVRAVLSRHRRGSEMDRLPDLTGAQIQPPSTNQLRSGLREDRFES